MIENSVKLFSNMFLMLLNNSPTYHVNLQNQRGHLVDTSSSVKEIPFMEAVMGTTEILELQVNF